MQDKSWKRVAAPTLITLSAGLVAFGVTSTAGSDDGRLVTALQLRTVFGVFDAYLESAANTFTIEQLVRHGQAVLVAEPGSIAELTRARVARADLPDPGVAPLDKLRSRLDEAETEGLVDAPLLSRGARRNLTTDLIDAGWVIRTRAELRGGIAGGLALWALAWLLLITVITPGAASPWPGRLLGASAALTALHLTVLQIQAGPLTGAIVMTGLAKKVGLACAIATGLVLVSRKARAREPWPSWITNGQLSLLLALLGIVVMAIFGHGPRGSNSKVNLQLGSLALQPLELVKAALLIGVAQYVGRNAASFSVAFTRLSRTSPPSPRLLVPFALAGGLIIADALLLDDYGSAGVVVLASVLLVVAFTGSRLVALVMSAGLVAGVGSLGYLPLGAKIARRAEMYLNPWTNGVASADQIARSLWAMASGGVFGMGTAASSGRDVPAAHTDLVFATVAEAGGLLTVLGCLLLYGAVIGSALVIAARTDHARAERTFGVTALVALFSVQVVLSVFGNFGLIPLSGIVVPLLSHGGTAQVVFIAALALVANSGCGLARRAARVDIAHHEHRHHQGLALVLVAVVILFGAAAAKATKIMWWDADEIAKRPLVTERRDGNISVVYNPRVTRLRNDIPRPLVRDRKGHSIVTDAPMGREHHFGAALGTVTGLAGGNLNPLPGTLEAYVTKHDGLFPRVTLPVLRVDRCVNPPCGTKGWSHDGVVRADDARGLAEIGRDPNRRAVRLVARDLAALVPIARLGGVSRVEALQALVATRQDFVSTLDGTLTRDVYEVADRARAASHAPMVAVVVVEAKTGHVIVNTASPGLDAGAFDPRRSGHPEMSGVWGALRDHGARALLPPGSIFKTVTAVAALERRALLAQDCADDRRGHGQRGSFRAGRGDASGWVMDAARSAHGRLGLVEALCHSCNVAFAKLGLAVGAAAVADVAGRISPKALQAVPAPGIELAWTAVGQGGALMTPLDVATMFAAIANQGRTKRCETIRLADRPATCVDVQLTTSAVAARVARGLKAVVNRPGCTGHAARPAPTDSFTIWGKTGTAQQPLVPRETGSAADHAWFGGFLEGTSGARYAFAILVARGGSGGRVAAPIAPELGRLLDAHGYLGPSLAQAP